MSTVAIVRSGTEQLESLGDWPVLLFQLQYLGAGMMGCPAFALPVFLVLMALMAAALAVFTGVFEG